MLKWYGEQLNQKMAKASMHAIDRVMADCVREAQDRAPMKTGKLRKEIQILAPAKAVKDGYHGRWGVRKAWYAWIVEKGSRAHVAKPKDKAALSWPGAMHPIMFAAVRAVMGRPFLGPAADIHYPKTAQYIREKL